MERARKQGITHGVQECPILSETADNEWFCRAS